MSEMADSDEPPPPLDWDTGVSVTGFDGLLGMVHHWLFEKEQLLMAKVRAIKPTESHFLNMLTFTF